VRSGLPQVERRAAEIAIPAIAIPELTRPLDESVGAECCPVSKRIAKLFADQTAAPVGSR